MSKDWHTKSIENDGTSSFSLDEPNSKAQVFECRDWQIKNAGTEMGPFSLTELIEKAKIGQISTDTLVHKGKNPWARAESFRFLSEVISQLLNTKVKAEVQQTGVQSGIANDDIKVPIEILHPSLFQKTNPGNNLPLGIYGSAAVLVMLGILTCSGVVSYFGEDNSPEKTKANVSREKKNSNTEAILTGEQIRKQALKSIVWINNPGIGRGSGFLVNVEEKLILTNNHVVLDASFLLVNFPDYDDDNNVIADRTHYLKTHGDQRDKLGAKVLVLNEAKDLALLKINFLPEGVEALPLAKESARAGQKVHSVGNPGASGALWGYTSGTVRTDPFRRKWKCFGAGRFMELDALIIETQSPTNPGDSGGPLMNDSLELVGVTQGVDTASNSISLFVDVVEVRSFLREHGYEWQEKP